MFNDFIFVSDSKVLVILVITILLPIFLEHDIQLIRTRSFLVALLKKFASYNVECN